MLAITPKSLSEKSAKKMAEYSADIQSIVNFSEQYAKAKMLWESKTPSNLFDELKTTLKSMCSGVQRCMYCEDSQADEIEHRRPKRLYPEQTFDWDNLLYACGVCNTPKSNKFAVLIQPLSAGYTEITAKKDAPVRPPVGIDALIDPRAENPMDLLDLELDETFRFSPRIADKTSVQHWKAHYTIKILDLNKETRWKMRRSAYHSYRSSLREYVSDKIGKRQAFQEFLRDSHHRTVWEEMKRQYSHKDDLRELFGFAPEVLTW